MLINELQKANIQAMKDKNQNKRSILSVVLTKCKLQEVELRSKGLEMEDSKVLEVIQKSLKELSDEKQGYIQVGNKERVKTIEEQENILKDYLPAQLGEAEIREIISKLEDKSIPSIMKHFKTNYAGQVDMSLVSQIARSL